VGQFDSQILGGPENPTNTGYRVKDMTKQAKMPKDTNQRAASIVAQATAEEVEPDIHIRLNIAAQTLPLRGRPQKTIVNS
jgi:hypothetical protein